MTKKKFSKAARRRAKKKERKCSENEINSEISPSSTTKALANDIEIEYVSAGYSDSTTMAEFDQVFAKFTKAEDLLQPRKIVSSQEEDEKGEEEQKEDNNNQDDKALSRRKQKILSRMSVAELKQLVTHPDVVESHDVTAPDPKLLVHLKGYRNAVPVPRHWCHKRRYLQGKRGLEKKPFRLPEFIAQTGIEKIRKAIEEAEALKKIKQQTRDRVHGRGARMDVDYQVLHDAFFKWQTKPKLSGPGQVYFEGKEYEVQIREKRPGQLSAALKAALGMPDGAPPPWLINMQRFGPPPAYPNLRIPGLNAPIPDGASFGYHPGGWGKPPVDEYGVPLYGDVFGARKAMASHLEGDDFIPDRTHWAELQIDHDEEEDDDDDEDDAYDKQQSSILSRGGEGHTTTYHQSTRRGLPVGGTETPLDDGTASVISSGTETPSGIDLRKRPDSIAMSDEPRALYQLIEEERAKADARAAGLFTSEKRYRVPTLNEAGSEYPSPSLPPPPSNSRRRNDDDDDDDDDLGHSNKKNRRLDDGSSTSSRRRQREFKF
mmetsp:Transcript_20394/g.25330  ORF Transcript_20394/g.25330 Transcript_20394/m.25330 type:complete len:545 (+) Transcript_20394:43-1677(+)